MPRSVVTMVLAAVMTAVLPCSVSAECIRYWKDIPDAKRRAGSSYRSTNCRLKTSASNREKRTLSSWIEMRIHSFIRVACRPPRIWNSRFRGVVRRSL